MQYQIVRYNNQILLKRAETSIDLIISSMSSVSMNFIQDGHSY